MDLQEDRARETCRELRTQEVARRLLRQRLGMARDAHGINPGRGYVRMALVPDLADCIEAAQRIVALCN